MFNDLHRVRDWVAARTHARTREDELRALCIMCLKHIDGENSGGRGSTVFGSSRSQTVSGVMFLLFSQHAAASPRAQQQKPMVRGRAQALLDGVLLLVR